MARYVIGDIQGCYDEFIQLVEQINFNPSCDTLYLVGDLVNRGPKSLEVLQWIYQYQDSVISVLGNHDIFLLGRYAKILMPSKDETIQDILQFKQAQKLIDWLRTCPLVFQDRDYILVHAGIYPKISLDTLTNISSEVSKELQSPNYAAFITDIYGNKPNIWDEKLSLTKKMKFITNACTRMRFLNQIDYSLDYKYKGDLANIPDYLIPWFKVDGHPSVQKKILFGHWAALGFYHNPKFISLDTGCVWGKRLTAFNLDTEEIYQINAKALY